MVIIGLFWSLLVGQKRPFLLFCRFISIYYLCTIQTDMPDNIIREDRQAKGGKVAVVERPSRNTNNMANIEQLQNSGSQTLLLVSVADLAEFGRALIEQAQESTKQHDATNDVKLTTSQVVKVYGVSRPTLWRWQKSGFLCPCGKIGSRQIYSSLDVEKALGYAAK